MKKRLLLLLLLLIIPFQGKAETILDNYRVDINIDGKKINVKESFYVVETREEEYNFRKQLLAFPAMLNIKSNDIKNLEKFSEQEYVTFLMGEIKNARSYHIQYEITDFTYFGTHIYDFHAPEQSKITNLSFHVSCLNEKNTCSVYGFDEDTYDSKEDGKEITGIYQNKEKDPHFSIGGKYEEPVSETQEGLDSSVDIEPFSRGNENNIRYSIFLIVATLVVGIMLLKKEGKRQKKYINIYAIALAILIIIPSIVTEPFIFFLHAVVTPFYGAFYYGLFFNSTEKYHSKLEEIFMKNFVFLFLAVHSYFFLGMYIGYIPHLLNNVSIYIAGIIYQKYIQKKKNSL